MNKKILVVDDDPAITEFLSVRLGAGPYEVKTINKGSEAEATIMREKPDLILMDINMPDTDGFTATENIQKWSSSSKTPLVFITAGLDPSLRTKAEELGAAGFIEKPINSNKLIRLIEKLLGE